MKVTRSTVNREFIAEQFQPGKPIDGVQEFTEGPFAGHALLRQNQRGDPCPVAISPGDWVLTNPRNGAKSCVSDEFFQEAFSPVPDAPVVPEVPPTSPVPDSGGKFHHE